MTQPDHIIVSADRTRAALSALKHEIESNLPVVKKDTLTLSFARAFLTNPVSESVNTLGSHWTDPVEVNDHLTLDVSKNKILDHKYSLDLTFEVKFKPLSEATKQ